MKTAIMQPYFLPYIGYWQLINAVDVFVIYDNIQYTKKGWFNRNRFLQNGKATLFSIPLKKDSDYLNVNRRSISPEFDKNKLINQFQNAYHNTPYKYEILPLIKEIIIYENDNLFEYIYNSIKQICNSLDIKTKIIISSSIDIDHNLKSAEKVKAICSKLETEVYINPIGGESLYNKEDFLKSGIDLKFIKTKPIVYEQFNNTFVENLSIVDIMMFNPSKQIRNMLEAYELI